MGIYEFFNDFFIYGFFGWCTEVAFAAIKQKRFVNRGFLNGPICPIYGIGVTAVVMLLDGWKDNTAALLIFSAVLVTVLEWITGFLLEKLFHHKWWDYSHMPLNLGGYVCLLFSVIWGAACVIIVKFIHPLIHTVYMLLPLWLSIMLLSLLCVALAADIGVTVSGILKFNRKLEKMNEIASELHWLSDQIGENIYENMMEGIRRQEQVKEKAREKTEERIEELRERYAAFLEHSTTLDRRLLKAFPKLHSKVHEEILNELRQRYTGHENKSHREQ